MRPDDATAAALAAQNVELRRLKAAVEHLATAIEGLVGAVLETALEEALERAGPS